MMLNFSQFQPSDNTESNSMCMITFETSDAILLKEAVTGKRCAQTVISAEWPHRIRFVSDAFTSAFGFSPAQTLGNNISLFRSPTTDVLGWCTVLQTAIDGQATTSNLRMRTSSGADIDTLVCCVPVVEALNGPITHLLLQLKPLPPDAAAFGRYPSLSESQYASASGSEGSTRPQTPEFCSRSQSPVDGEQESPSPPPPAPASDSAAAAAATEPASELHGGGSGGDAADCTMRLRIHTRRKANEPGGSVRAPSRPLILTRPLLDALAAAHPLRRAAAQLGMSQTSLKAACRKLGVSSWPRRRGPDYRTAAAVALGRRLGVAADGPAAA